MIGERSNEGWQLRLRSSGRARYVSAAFLAFWLCGWAAGEAFALWILIKGAIALLTGTPPDPGRSPLELGPAVMVGAFLLLWLTLWTIGGIAAGAELLRLLWGEDRITVAAGRLVVTWSRGIFRRTRTFERSAIQRITLVGKDDRIALETNGRRVELSGLGSRAERAAAAAALRTELMLTEPSSTGVTLPREWEEIITPEGERAVVANRSTRRAQARFASVVTLLLGGVSLVLARESLRRIDLIVPAIICLVFTIGLAAGTVWLARGRMEWKIGSGRLTLRKRYGSSVRDVFEGRRLKIDLSTDSDGDTSYELRALGAMQEPDLPVAVRVRTSAPKNSRVVARAMNDSSTVRDLAAWLSNATGIAVEDVTTPQAQAIQLAELRAALESSGRFGKWAARLVDRLEDKHKKAG